ncbi:DUF3558 domain-containing protein [Actinokineospora sp. PR83]|uniref:DUF3558 family protein n=1 Tax=Actinokineospora sp. PR83 TaxID=2884908 RepID=UPI001F477198|nr:DUF3558 family protein [Actinokineospora sp. PR83]MCG8915531.1 DUF3558 domain-containing protein [Actinokineospora sp. PR83]
MVLGRVVVGSVVAALLGGCAAGASQVPTVTAAGRPTAAPAATRTLDLAKAVDPCAVVPKSIPLGLGVYGPGQPHGGEAGSTRFCVWADRVEWPRISVGFSDNDPLAAAYQDSARPGADGTGLRWKLFEQISVDGQPALVRAQRTDGTVLCEVVVGAGNGGGVVVAAGASGANDTKGQCQTAVSVAEQVVTALR